VKTQLGLRPTEESPRTGAVLRKNSNRFTFMYLAGIATAEHKDRGTVIVPFHGLANKHLAIPTSKSTELESEDHEANK
jgi:hypothetical protein